MTQENAEGASVHPIRNDEIAGKLEELEMRTLEVHFLKIQNLKLQADKLQEDMMRCRQMMLDEQKKLQTYRDGVAERLGVDLSKCRIEQDGTVRHGAMQFPVPGVGMPGVAGA